MPSKQQIQSDLIAAMKAKDDAKTNALRMLKAAILKFEVSGDRKEASESDIADIIVKEIKQRQDSAEQFRAGNRIEMAENEEAEIAVLKSYLPPQMSEEEVTALVKEVIQQVGATSKADMGKVMGALMPKVKGKADGGVVNKIVSSLLS